MYIHIYVYLLYHDTKYLYSWFLIHPMNLSCTLSFAMSNTTTEFSWNDGISGSSFRSRLRSTSSWIRNDPILENSGYHHLIQDIL